MTARRPCDGLTITRRATSGIGMPPDASPRPTTGWHRPSGLTSTLVGTMGLLVVARLAQRHGIGVRLEQHSRRRNHRRPSCCPTASCCRSPAEDRLYSGRWLREPRELDATPTHAALGRSGAGGQHTAGAARPRYFPPVAPPALRTLPPHYLPAATADLPSSVPSGARRRAPGRDRASGQRLQAPAALPARHDAGRRATPHRAAPTAERRPTVRRGR